jgi:hypothetical protein
MQKFDILLSLILIGNYHGALSDAEAATELQPTFLKAFIRGKIATIKHS